MTTYATIDDFTTHGLPSRAVDDEWPIDGFLDAASRVVDSYLATRYAVPFTVWPPSITQCVCKIAAWEYVSGQRGRQPGGPDEVIRLRFEDAMRWLREVSAGKVSLIGVTDVDAPVPDAPGAADVESDDLRGW